MTNSQTTDIPTTRKDSKDDDVNRLASIQNLAAKAGARKLRCLKEAAEAEARTEVLTQQGVELTRQNKALAVESENLSNALAKAKDRFEKEQKESMAELDAISKKINEIKDSNDVLIAKAEAEAKRILDKARKEVEEILTRGEAEYDKLEQKIRSEERTAQDNLEKAKKAEQVVIDKQKKAEKEYQEILRETAALEPRQKELVSTELKLAKTAQKLDDLDDKIIEMKLAKEEADIAAKAAQAIREKEEKEAEKLVAKKLEWGQKNLDLKDFELELKNQARLAGMKYPFS